MKKFSWLVKIAAVVASVLLVFGASYAYATGQTVTGNINFLASFSQPSVGGITSNTLGQAIGQNLRYNAGTASNQTDTIYAATLNLAGAATTLDLSALTDPAGNSINFARVRELIILNQATTAGYDVLVLGGATNPISWLPASGGIPCRYGSVIRISDPVSTGASNGNVIGATTKTMKLDPGANTVSVLVLIVGGSAA